MAFPISISDVRTPSVPQKSGIRNFWRRSVENVMARCDLNVAAFKYQNVMVSDGGPIEKIEVTKVGEGSEACYFANAYISEQIIKRPVRTSKIYCHSDGHGVHAIETIARFMAISEAMERWAFQVYAGSEMHNLYGFDVDGSTNGMAAFPGMLRAKARERARIEALERYALLNWWEGHLEHRVHVVGEDRSMRAVEILVPDTTDSVVVLFEDDRVTGTRHYGYGAGKNLTVAIERAKTELMGHRLVAHAFCERYPDPELGMLAIKSHQERRAIFFALEEGQSLFDERLSLKAWAPYNERKVVFNDEIPGEWDKYATVWRCLYEPPSDEFTSNRSDYFFW